MIIRVSFLVVTLVAALAVSHIKPTPPAKKNSRNKSSGSKGSHLQDEFGDTENGNANAIHSSEEEEENKTTMPRNQLTGDFQNHELFITGDKPSDITEMELLQNLVREYKQKQTVLERKLIELKGLKEEQSTSAQLGRQLDEKMAKLEFLNTTMASLQRETVILGDKIREGVYAEKQLDIAKKRIHEMQKKKDVNSNPVKMQILMLQQQVTEFQKYDDCGRNAMLREKLKCVKDLELEVLELRRRNKELQLEKREVGMKLTTTAQARIIAEGKKLGKIKEEITCLRHANEELSDEVERLQGNRFDMVQELVYQRWLFAFLRFEVLNHQRRKTSIHDYCSHNSSKELYVENNASPFDPELHSISSDNTIPESDENDSTTTTTNATLYHMSEETEKYEKPRDSNECGGDNPSTCDASAENEANKNVIRHDSQEILLSREKVFAKEDKVKHKTQVLQQLLAFFFFFFLFILLAYFRVM